jgi:hypothetical protein
MTRTNRCVTDCEEALSIVSAIYRLETEADNDREWNETEIGTSRDDVEIKIGYGVNRNGIRRLISTM